MGLDELDSIPSEEEVDREDSGEDYYPIAFRSCLDLFQEKKISLKILRFMSRFFCKILHH